MGIVGRSFGVLARPNATWRVYSVSQRIFGHGFSTENQMPVQETPQTDATSTETPFSESFFDTSRISNGPVITNPVRRRPYNIEAKMRLQQYRRQAEQQRRAAELEEERRTFQLDHSQLYPKGHPDTVLGVVKEIINIGYIISLPNGREGLLAAQHLGCSGGVELLTRLYPLGSEVPVRVIETHMGGKDRCYVKP